LNISRVRERRTDIAKQIDEFLQIITVKAGGKKSDLSQNMPGWRKLNKRVEERISGKGFTFLWVP